MATLTIDGKEYDTETLPPEARNQFEAIQFIQAEIVRMERQIAAMQTARSTYGLALKEILEGKKGERESEALDQMPSSISFE